MIKFGKKVGLLEKPTSQQVMEAHLNQIGRNKIYERQVSETKKKEEQEKQQRKKESEMNKKRKRKEEKKWKGIGKKCRRKRKKISLARNLKKIFRNFKELIFQKLSVRSSFLNH